MILACSLASAAAAAARARSFSLPVSAGYESEVLSVGPCVLLASCLRIPSACVCPLSTGRRVRERGERERGLLTMRESGIYYERTVTGIIITFVRSVVCSLRVPVCAHCLFRDITVTSHPMLLALLRSLWWVWRATLSVPN